MTKMGKAITDVAYNVNEDENEDDDDDDEAVDEDEKLARKLANETAEAGRRSKRLARDPSEAAVAAEGVAERERKQIVLMNRRNEERVRELAKRKRTKQMNWKHISPLAIIQATYSRIRSRSIWLVNVSCCLFLAIPFPSTSVRSRMSFFPILTMPRSFVSISIRRESHSEKMHQRTWSSWSSDMPRTPPLFVK